MAEPLRHRQTKEADNRYVRPTATAPHLDSTISVGLAVTLTCRLHPRLRTNIGSVSALDDAVATFNATERRAGKTVIRVRP